jgi:hypothetical protein
MGWNWYEFIAILTFGIFAAIAIEKLNSKNDHHVNDKELEDAHKFSFKNRAEILKSNQVGCFYCQAIYAAKEIDDYTDSDDETALCARCGIDSVIGDASGLKLSRDFLEAMYSHYF